MTDHCPTCGAAVRIEASGVTHYMVPVDAERVSELESLLEAVLDCGSVNDQWWVDRVKEALEPPR